MNGRLILGYLYGIVGDFFKDFFSEADLYILVRILYDWTDEKCVYLLERVYRACKLGRVGFCISGL